MMMTLLSPPPPTVLRLRAVSFALGQYKVFIEKLCRRNLKKDSFEWKFKALVSFLIVEIDWRITNTPLTSTISPNTSDQNFEIAILFDIV